MNDKFTRLENLIAMKKEGLVDDFEFKQMKQEILGNFDKLKIRTSNNLESEERLRI